MHKNPLLVFALQSESRGLFDAWPHIHTGVGKVQATYALTRALSAPRKPSLVINLGSAGSAVHKAATVLCCTKFVQRDMDVTPLGFAPHATPFALEPPILSYGIAAPNLPAAICGTGDRFETAHTGESYCIVDMESYALALVCQREGMPFMCLKYITDGADGQAAQDWESALESGAQALHQALARFLEDTM